jgi:hypothetical protein
MWAACPIAQADYSLKTYEPKHLANHRHKECGFVTLIILDPGGVRDEAVLERSSWISSGLRE